ncbi:MAG: phosphoribosylformylglycinamidine synthase [Oscillospiraceae bacterium]|nr:phosphoribosylformylglycinamidine synthase [Oscillospiraceae bacterium]
MPKVIRIFVEKRDGFNVEAKQILSDLRDNLGLNSLKSLRLLNRYDIEGLSDEQVKRVIDTVFSEPNVDDVYIERFNPGDGCRIFAMEYLPGQYDQRADSAAQCIQLLTHAERPRVATARVVCLHGNISDKDFEAVKSYLVNPLDSRIASMDKPETLNVIYETPGDVQRVDGFIMMTASQLEDFCNSMGFAMSLEDLEFCQSYFRDQEKRNPTITELRVIDTYWSDHCRHTTFLTKLSSIEVAEGELSTVLQSALDAYYQARRQVYKDNPDNKNVTLMDMATMGMRLLKEQGLIPDLDQSYEINACSIKVPVEVDGKTEEWLVQFKNETHNHPTEIEPFGGAATCLGGAIRDPLSGRAYVYQAMRVTGSGDPRVSLDDTLPGKLPTRKITTGAAAGYSSYGNQIGLATGHVAEIYDPGYVAKRMEIGAVIGASPAQNVIREVPLDGDVVVLLGGRTGRDGCGGATGSSKAHTIESIDTCGAEVQKGNPPTERKIQRLFRNGAVSRMIRRCNDFGAGGVCVAIGELADGLDIYLDKVPKKYEGLDGTELAISESQERMAVVLSPNDVDAFIAAADSENLEATVVATVTKENRLRMTWRGDRIVDISRDFLNTNGVTQNAKVRIIPPNPQTDYTTSVPAGLAVVPIAQAFKENLGRLEVACQKGLVERFDSSVGAATVNMPFAGKYQLTPEEGMAAKIPVMSGDTDTATAMTFGFMPGISRWSPFHGAAYAVTISLARLAAMGVDALKARLTFQEYFERLRDVPERWGKPAAALLGAFIAQKELGVPSIGGKDSMSGSFNDMDVPPTLVSFAVGITKASQVGTAAFQRPGSLVAFIPLPVDNQTRLPDWRRTKELLCTISSLVQKGDISSASVVLEGGAAAAVSRMCFGNKIGFAFHGELDRVILFAPLAGSFVVELKEGDGCLKGLDYTIIGSTIEEKAVIIDNQELPLDDLIEQWINPLSNIFPIDPNIKPTITHVPFYNKRENVSPSIRTAKPRVFIPVFPGTNCEYDTARAFERAGAIPDTLVVKNLSAAAIGQTIECIEKAIRSSQIIMIPGGFSGGDEPDGSGKFIATTFRNPRIADAIAELLEKRDGLILGICNGFQALIKLGLVPYGRIIKLNEHDPTLTFNTLGRHVSRMVYTRVTSVKSPWLSLCNVGDIHCMPVSHGEGRFYATESLLHKLASNGQIATQYVSPDGKPSADIEWNPNGSLSAVEGITSPDGRVFGKMGHSERYGENLYKNVPGNKNQMIFESGVNYFK